MDREDIIRMAREAGISRFPDNWGDAWWQADSIAELERFAALVAAAEREACAKVCEAYTDNDGGKFIDHEGHGYECASAIRARGQA